MNGFARERKSIYIYENIKIIKEKKDSEMKGNVREMKVRTSEKRWKVFL